MELKEFTISDVFEKVDMKMIDKKAKDFPESQDAEYCIPLLTCQNTNQGFARYAKRDDCPQVLKNVISVAANGTAVAFYQPNEFAILQDAYAVKLKDGTEFDEKTGLFLAIVLNKFLVDNQYCWTNKAGWNKISDEKIWIPVKKDEKGKEKIDFKYMREAVEEMEREAVEEMEKYLKAAGLDDCELTEEEKAVYNMELVEGASGEYEREASEFKLEDLFSIKTPVKKFNANIVAITQNIGHPYVVRTSVNNGIRGYIDEDEKYLNDANTFSFGQDTATVFWQEEPYFTGDKIKVLKPKFVCDSDIACYIGESILMAFKHFTWGGQSFSMDVLNNTEITLPIQTDQAGVPIIDPEHKFHESGFIPDWDFMKNYIKAAEKEVIKELADENEKKISQLPTT